MDQQQCSVVDPVWETIDPTPNLHSLFLAFDKQFFNGTLAMCEVKWSSRMTSSAGVCSYEGRGGLCSIRLSEPLLIFRPRKDLVETLLHEMIHAYLFVTERDTDRDGHGPTFQYHMRRINALANVNVTIYHDFRDEVAFYKQHWWRCDGICRNRPPFYGWVKRATNRAPSKNDFWSGEHERSCGGKFIKVKEPEGYNDKRKKAGTNSKIQSKGVQQTLNTFFTGKSIVLGGSSFNEPEQKRTETQSTTASGVFSTQSNDNSVKVKIPNGENAKKRKETHTAVAKKPKSPRKPSSALFPGKGYVLGEVSSNELENDHAISQLARAYGSSSSTHQTSALSNSVLTPTDLIQQEVQRLANTSESITGDNNPSGNLVMIDENDELAILVKCPSCNLHVCERSINNHLDLCLTKG